MSKSKNNRMLESGVFLEDTGERMIPEHHKGRNIYGSHIARYMAAEPFVKDKIVLDIASGSGYGTHLLSQWAKKVYGVDIDTSSVKYAQDNFSSKNIEFQSGSGVKIPLKDDAVDVVVTYETIEHIPDYKKFMSEISRVLKPGGVLLISTPNGAEYPKGNPYHIDEFHYGELKKLVKSYFKYHNDYFQTQWLTSTILPQEMQSSEWDQQIRTVNTCGLSPEQSIYFFLVCSDDEIKTSISPLSVIGEHHRQLDVLNKFLENETQKHKLKLEIERYKDLYTKEQSERIAIINSKSWRLSAPLRLVNAFIKGSAKKQ